MIDLLVAAGIAFVVGYAAGLCQFIKAGHKCKANNCYAMVGNEHDFCAGHHDRRHDG